MDPTQTRYWPFDVLPPEQQSEQHRREIRFLEAAYQAGYRPYVFGSQNFGATAGTRGGIVLWRSSQGKHWELLLGTPDETLLSAHVDDFDCAAEAILSWLRGGDEAGIAERLQDHLLVTPSTPHGVELYG